PAAVVCRLVAAAAGSAGAARACGSGSRTRSCRGRRRGRGSRRTRAGSSARTGRAAGARTVPAPAPAAAGPRCGAPARHRPARRSGAGAPHADVCRFRASLRFPQPVSRVAANPAPSIYRGGAYVPRKEDAMASQADDRIMISERVAPGMLPRVLNSFDMTIIFVAIVLFIVNASAIQQAHQAAYTYWILGFLLFLIPGALVTAQLGQMFPQEGSLYVWTQKALGPFWGFFAGFCAWWPGILVMVATGDAVVTIWQFVDKGGLPKAWEQGLVILAVLWFSALMSMLRLRMTQTYAHS